MLIEDMKEKLINGELDKGVFVSHNEKGEHQLIEIRDNYLSIKTSQENGWLRENIYTYENGTWTYEELYDK